MNISKEIIGDNKERDYEICRLYCEGKNSDEIVEIGRYDISPRRVRAILYNNVAYLNKYLPWPKTRRIQKRQRFIENSPQTKKDVVDQLNDLQREIEGEKSLIDMSVHKHLTKVEVQISNDTRVPLAHKAGDNTPRQIPV